MGNRQELKIKMKYRGADLNIDFEDGVCLLQSSKSNVEEVVIEAVREHCKKNNIDCRYVCADMIDSRGRAVDRYGRVDASQLVKDVCSGGEVIILDNADLYVTGKELNVIAKDDNMVIAVMQNPGFISSNKRSYKYFIKSDESSGELTTHKRIHKR